MALKPYGQGLYGAGRYGPGRADVVPPSAPLEFAAQSTPAWLVGWGFWRGEFPEQYPAIRAWSLDLSLTDASSGSLTLVGALGDERIPRRDIDDLWWYRDGELIARHRVRDVSLRRGVNSWEATVATVDYRELLNRICLRGSVELDLTGQVLASAVRNLLASAQSAPGADLSIMPSALWPAGSYVLPDTRVRVGDGTWDVLKTLTAGRADFVVSPQRVAMLYEPSLEVDNGESLTHLQNCSALEEQAGVAYANVVRMSGGPAAASFTAQAPDLAVTPTGRIEVVLSDPGLLSSAMVAEAARAGLAERSVAIPSYQGQLIPGYWKGPDHIGLGHLVAVRAGGDLDDQGRVVSMSISVGANNDEKVALTVGRPRTNTVKVLAALIKRSRSFGLRA